jgi:hypothetical protein
MLKHLLSTKDIKEFCSLFFDMGRGESAALPALFRDACLYASSSLYQEQYPAPHHFVPHSYMGLITGWQLREYLKEIDWWRPLVQALWYLAHEVKGREIAVEEPVKEITLYPHDLTAAFSEAWDKGDFEAFYSLYVACQKQPKLGEMAAKTLLSIAIRDHTNIGHKYIYIVKAIQLSQYTHWEDSLIFYAPIHFLVIAPKDLRIFLIADAQLGPFKEKLCNFATNQKTIEYVKVIQLRDSIINGQEGDILKLLIDLLTQGYSVASIADGLLLIASHIIYYAPYEDLRFWWLYPVHGFNFAQSVHYGLNFMEPYDRVLAILITGLYLREIVRSSGKMEENGSIESFDGVSKASLEQLGEAVENTDVAAALDQVKGLIAKRTSFTRLAEKLVLLSVKNERFLFTHVVKYLYYILYTLKDSPSPWANQHLIGFIKFLTLTIKDREVVKVAEETRFREPKSKKSKP